MALADSTLRAMTDPSELLVESIRRAVIGEDATLPGPFGARRIVYADYTASGRALSFVEDYIREQVLPCYANTHTEASGTGRQTTWLREEARRIIGEAVHAGPEDRVLFCGSGATGAIDKLSAVLGLRIPSELDARYGLSQRIPVAERPVVFVGPHEHHSNELPWRESIATVVAIPEGADGTIDLTALEAALRRHADRPLKIGTFSAASNVTGRLADTLAVSELLHRFGALSFWDYAAAGPYLEIDMNPSRPGVLRALLEKDAVFLSPHKFVGGPGAAGVLVAKRKLFNNRVPSVPSGGTIAYVNADVHHYTPDIVSREEGGTPAILGAIRAGLVFQLKQAVGCRAIAAREESFCRRAIESFRANPQLVLLGDLEAPRLPIISFLVRHEDRFLHHNYVVTLLSDLLGVQARGGCSCAGPYGHALLGVGAEASLGFERQVLRGRLGIKPGWARVNFSYFFSEQTFQHIVRAVHFVANHGAALLPHYEFHPQTAEWSHRSRRPLSLARLGTIDYRAGRMNYSGRQESQSEDRLPSQLQEAERLIAACRVADHPAHADLPEDFERLRWFTMPAEAAAARRGERLTPLPAHPINPRAAQPEPEPCRL